MIISTLRFSGYEWEHNPLSLKIEHKRNVTRSVIVQSCERLSDIGLGCIVISGKGELIGSDCIKKYEELKSLFEKGGNGILSVPGITPFYASFTNLSVIEDTTPELIVYAFEFTQTESGNDIDETIKVHICEADETLYDIAYNYKLALERLVELNPQICRIDELSEGEEVRLC